MKRASGCIMLATLIALAYALLRPPVAEAKPWAAKRSLVASPTSNWNGLYFGLNAGFGWGGRISSSGTPVFCDQTLGGCNPNQSAVAAATAVPPTLDTGPTGFIGGGQIGYNIQTGPIVWGLETDFQKANLSGGDTKTFSAPVVTFPGVNVNVTGSGHQRLDWLGTLRGRVGWKPIDSLLVYATGGLAYGHGSVDISFLEHHEFCACGPDAYSSASDSFTRGGWSFGGGLEWMFAPHWSLRGEYLYYDLGHITLSNRLTQTNSLNAIFTIVDIQSTASVHGDIARMAINYKF